MSLQFPATNYLAGLTRTNEEMRDAFEAFLARCKSLPGGMVASAQAIASGKITPDRELIYVMPESGSTDNLDALGSTGLDNGFRVTLGAYGVSSTCITVRHNQGGAGTNLLLQDSANYALYPGRFITLALNAGNWIEVDRYEPPWAHGVAEWHAAVSTTWTCPQCVTSVRVTAIGGGGGGGGGAGSGVGAGNGVNGSAGGNTVFGAALVTAVGGAAGAQGLTTGQGGACGGIGGHGGNGSGTLYGRGGTAAPSPVGSTYGCGGAGGNGAAGAGGGGAGALGSYGILPTVVAVVPGTVYTVTVGAGGAGGAGGTAGTGGAAGTAGATGSAGFLMLEW